MIVFNSVRGGPFDTWGGYGFLPDQTFFDSQLKRTIFRPDQKQTIFFSAVQHKTIYFFAIYFLFDF